MPETPPRPFDDELLLALAREHGTPLFVYDAATIRARVGELKALFPVVRYAQNLIGVERDKLQKLLAAQRR